MLGFLMSGRKLATLVPMELRWHTVAFATWHAPAVTLTHVAVWLCGCVAQKLTCKVKRLLGVGIHSSKHLL